MFMLVHERDVNNQHWIPRYINITLIETITAAPTLQNIGAELKFSGNKDTMYIKETPQELLTEQKAPV